MRAAAGACGRCPIRDSEATGESDVQPGFSRRRLWHHHRMILQRLTLALVVMAMCGAACTLKEKEDERATGKLVFPAPKDVAAPPADALKTPSGLASKVLIVGLGTVHPTLQSTVTVHYTGWTADGKMFETSRGGPP